METKKEQTTKVSDILHHKDDEQQPQKGVIILRGKVRNDATKKKWYLKQLDGQDVSSLCSGEAGGIGAPNTNGLNRVLEHVALAEGESHRSIPQHLDVADRKDAIMDMARKFEWPEDETAKLENAIDNQKDNLITVMRTLQEEVERRRGGLDDGVCSNPSILNLFISPWGTNDHSHAMGAVVKTDFDILRKDTTFPAPPTLHHAAFFPRPAPHGVLYHTRRSFFYLKDRLQSVVEGVGLPS